jgi:tRNA (guanine26-N2/guanine27-N2)-dimethyltransferase
MNLKQIAILKTFLYREYFPFSMKSVEEGKAKIVIPKYDKITAKMPVFYNPAMKLNRDISVLVLDSIEENNLLIADPLAGSGIRSIRFLLELNKKKIKKIYINDYSKIAIKYLRKNLLLNKINKNKIKISNKDANIFLLESFGFDYIDIDPFGYPGRFWDSAIKRMSKKGILAVTATDTSALCGSSSNACLRKYGAKPLRNECMHELGIRILIKALQTIGAKYEKALVPLFSFSKEHYMRVFLQCEKSKKSADDVLKNHGYFLYCKECLFRAVTKDIFNSNICPNCKKELDYAGSLWLGQLWDNDFLKKINLNKAPFEAYKLLETINEEAKIDAVAFYEINKICEKYNIERCPKINAIIDKLRKKNQATRTHFSNICIRTDADIKEVVKVMRAI